MSNRRVKDVTNILLEKAVLKFNEEAKPNDLIQLLIKEVELYSFAEKIPTINEIFISKVTTES